MARKRETFGSSAAAVMAMAGSAIGLGNIWRFPYMVGKNGGAAFIILYFLCIVFLSLPIMLSENIIGRRSRANTFGAMDKLAPGTKWKWLGILTVVSPLIILSFYSVVGGWSIGFLFKSAFQGFGADATSLFAAYTSSVWIPLLTHTAFLLLTAVIVSAGVKSGIERFNKLSLPLLFLFIVIIAVYSVTLPGAGEGVRFLVKPDFSRITPSIAAEAMGQGFFSLSLGVGTILTYSSYMKKEDNLLKAGLGTSVADLLFAVLAGFAVMPAVFAAGIEPGAGPGLIFETIPFIFANMGTAAPVLSRVVSVLFFFTIVIAALTSAISMFEVGVAYLVEEKGVSRRKAVLIIFGATWVLGCLCSLRSGVFDFCDKLTSDYLMTFGALLFVIFAGWKMSREEVHSEFTNGGTLRGNSRIFGFFYFLLRFVAPLVILLIFVSNLIG